VNWLFIHQNFPGQYVHLASHLAMSGHRVVAITQRSQPPIEGVRTISYAPTENTPKQHDYLRPVDSAVRNGLGAAKVCEELRAEGFVPGMVIGHNGWGELFYVKDVWPDVPLLGYFEFFYRASGSDVDFDPAGMADPGVAMRLRTRNAINLIGLDAVDWGHTPTQWQLDQYPARHRSRITVVHEGIDSAAVCPNPTARVWLDGGLSLGRLDEIITYSSRNLETYRGFDVFMRSLPHVLRARPNAHVLIVGGDGVSYGRKPMGAANWRHKLMAELADELDLRRVHFVGRLPFRQYLAVLQVSTVHVYLTYPFVLSWSLLEAMSAGCQIVASRTPPVQEVIADGDNGWLVDFFDTGALADRIGDALRTRHVDTAMRASARSTIVNRYDLHGVCLPAQLGMLARLTGIRGLAACPAIDLARV
jgi:glycosyltransferase involved in cell wall biosynthesis